MGGTLAIEGYLREAVSLLTIIDECLGLWETYDKKYLKISIFMNMLISMTLKMWLLEFDDPTEETIVVSMSMPHFQEQ